MRYRIFNVVHGGYLTPDGHFFTENLALADWFPTRKDAEETRDWFLGTSWGKWYAETPPKVVPDTLDWTLERDGS